MEDSFDPERLRYAGAPTTKPARPRIPRSSKPFVKMPRIWIEVLGSIPNASAATYRTALQLIESAWRAPDRKVKFTNTDLGTCREAKYKAIADLRGNSEQTASAIRAVFWRIPLLPSPGMAPHSASGGRGLGGIHGSRRSPPPRSPSVPANAASPAPSPLALLNSTARNHSEASRVARLRNVERSSNDSAKSTVTFRWRRCRRNSSLHYSTQCHRMRRSIG